MGRSDNKTRRAMRQSDLLPLNIIDSLLDTKEKERQ